MSSFCSHPRVDPRAKYQVLLLLSRKHRLSLPTRRSPGVQSEKYDAESVAPKNVSIDLRRRGSASTSLPRLLCHHRLSTALGLLARPAAVNQNKRTFNARLAAPLSHSRALGPYSRNSNSAAATFPFPRGGSNRGRLLGHGVPRRLEIDDSTEASEIRVKQSIGDAFRFLNIVHLRVRTANAILSYSGISKEPRAVARGFTSLAVGLRWRSSGGRPCENELRVLSFPGGSPRIYNSLAHARAHDTRVPSARGSASREGKKLNFPRAYFTRLINSARGISLRGIGISFLGTTGPAIEINRRTAGPAVAIGRPLEVRPSQ